MSTSPGALRLVSDKRDRGGNSWQGGAVAPVAVRRGTADVRARAARDAALLRDVVVALCAFGAAMVLAASPVVSIGEYGSPWSLFERQLMWVAIGGLVFAVAARLPIAIWQRRSTLLLAVAMGLLLAVLVPHIGSSAGGSSRWLGAGPISIQPSELAKLAVVVFAADLLTRRANASDQLRDVLRPLAIVVGAACVLILKQPDLGTALLLVCMTLAMCWAAGIRSRLLAATVLGAAGAALLAALASPYRRARLLSFVDPFAHSSTSGYQLVQSLLALGSGHMLGVGVGGSSATWGLLPNGQTDFIFSVIGNDLGLVGACVLLAGFVGFTWLGLRIAARATDRFSMLLATGMTCWIAGEALINVAGVIGLLPETGIPLPFVSFGGSSLVVALCASGMLVRIGRDAARAPARSSSYAPVAARPAARSRPAGAARARPAGGAQR